MWKPASFRLKTSWADTVSPENVWPEYPRPQLVRPHWLNLNGLWNYAVTEHTAVLSPKQIRSYLTDGASGHRNTGRFIRKSGKILVPFPIESSLSGVARPLYPDEKIWYWRSFTVPASWSGKRVLLHFGAVDWEAEVWVNDSIVGRHRGGYVPFFFDVTPFVKEGENQLVVSVWDPTDTFWQPRGKQVLQPHTTFYSAVSGIWQTVWLEPVPKSYIASLKITPDLTSDHVKVKLLGGGDPDGLHPVRIQVYDGGQPVAEVQTEFALNEINIPLPKPKLWTPDSPHLYDLEVIAGEDRVKSYFGMRSFSLGRDSRGHRRICLNGRAVFQFGPLEQGYWPDGLYTPPSDAAMRSDLDAIKGLNCNMLRKHVKVEPARYYYYCDKIGLIVWQDIPNGGKAPGLLGAITSRLLDPLCNDTHALWRFGRNATESRNNFLNELEEIIAYLSHFPCIATWVLFNEGWGQFEARKIADHVRALDPTRLVDHASGWFDQGGGDIESLHIYRRRLKPKHPEPSRALALSEFGGYGLRVEGHTWEERRKFGYKWFSSKAELTNAYVRLLENEILPWIDAGLSAAIYTQNTDVEIETNGYMTYDRKVQKLDFTRVAAVNHRAIQRGSATTVIEADNTSD